MADHARTLARLNGRSLRLYSARTVLALRAALPMRLALPHLEPVLVLNVGKEVEKDTAVILDAASSAPEAPDRRIERLVRMTRDIDDRFLSNVDRFPVKIVVRYEEILPFRTRRIRLLHGAATRLLAHASEHGDLRHALARAYDTDDLARLQNELFSLYAEEIRSLSRSVRLPAPLVPLREAISRELLDVLLRVAWPLSKEIAQAASRMVPSPPPAGTLPTD